MPPFCYADDGYCDRGYNNTTSELGHMFYNSLGNLGRYRTNGFTQSGYGVTNSSFTDGNSGDSVSIVNFQNSLYWFADRHSLEVAYSYAFAADNGYQGVHTYSLDGYSWAVRTGDVQPMPVPEAAWLFGMGLISLVGMKRGYR